MKISSAVLAGLALAFGQMAMAQLAPAHADMVFISGKYAYIQTEMCEGQITTTTQIVSGVTVVTGVNNARSGLIAVSNGYLTFTPQYFAATSGSVVASETTLVEGGSIRVSGNGFSMHQIAVDGSTTYSHTKTTFTLGGNVYKMTHADSTNGAPGAFFLVRLDTTNGNGNPNCLVSIAATAVIGGLRGGGRNSR